MVIPLLANQDLTPMLQWIEKHLKTNSIVIVHS